MTIINVPKELFFLNPFPFKYLIPIYIPRPDITKTKNVIIKNGMRVNIPTPDPRLNGIRKIDKVMVSIKTKREERRINIPTVLDFN